MNKPIKTRYIERHELQETFADSIEKCFFDGRLMHIEFCVQRMEEPKPPSPPTGTRHPVVRLVLTAESAVNLCNTLNKILTAAQLAATEGQKPN